MFSEYTYCKVLMLKNSSRIICCLRKKALTVFVHIVTNYDFVSYWTDPFALEFSW